MSIDVPLKKELDHTSRRGFITNLEGARKGFITNYPSVTQWGGMSEAEITAREPLNLYVHIPFCAQQCSYCYYRVVTGASKADMDRYVDALCRELEMAVELHNLRERPIKSIYYGGGTPTILHKDQLARLTRRIQETFPHIEGAEFTIEGEPVTLNQKRMDIFADLPIPVTRISMGVQSLDDEVVQYNQRKDTQARVIKAIEMARSTGCVVNIDLMSGLAGDSLEGWKRSVQRALETGVESITVYKTEVYANSQYFRELRNNAIHLPSDEEEMEYMDYALDAFAEADYKPWCFFTFTKNGDYPHVHATQLWRGEDYLALGTSAFGKLGDQLFQNSNDPEKYMQQIESGRFATYRGHRLTCKDKMVRTALLGMKLMSLDLEDFRKRHGFRLETLCQPELEELQEAGFITIGSQGDEGAAVVEMTRKGMLYGDYVGKRLGRALQDLA